MQKSNEPTPNIFKLMNSSDWMYVVFMTALTLIVAFILNYFEGFNFAIVVVVGSLIIGWGVGTRVKKRNSK